MRTTSCYVKPMTHMKVFFWKQLSKATFERKLSDLADILALVKVYFQKTKRVVFQKVFFRVWFAWLARLIDWLSSVLHPRQHSISYMGDGFFTDQKTQSTVSKYWRNAWLASQKHVTLLRYNTKEDLTWTIYRSFIPYHIRLIM